MMVFVYLIGLIALFITIYIARELRIYLRIQEFSKIEGVKTHYSPMITYLFSVQQDQTNGDALDSMRKHFTSKDSDFLACSNFSRIQMMVYPISSKACTEFFRKEKEYTVRHNNSGVDKLFGLIFQTGEEKDKNRLLFSKIFQKDNMARLMPRFREIVRIHFSKLEKKLKKSAEKSNQKTQKNEILVDLRPDMMDKMFEDLSIYIAFKKTSDQIDKVFGKSFVQAQTDNFNAYTNLMFSTINAVTMGLAVAWGFDPNIKLIKRNLKRMREICAQECNARLAEAVNGAVLGQTMLDELIRYNLDKKNADKIISLVDAAALMEAFVFGASDTTKHGSTGFISNMAMNPEIQQKFQKKMSEEIKEDYSMENLLENKFLDAMVKESMRLIPPAAVTFDRVLVKDMELGGMQLKRGDMVCIPIVSLENDPVYFPNPEVFDQDRWLKEGQESKYPKIPKNNYIPFLNGPNNCVGRLLGELMVKMVVVEFFRRFEVRKESEDWKMNIDFQPNYGVTNARFYVSLSEGK